MQEPLRRAADPDLTRLFARCEGAYSDITLRGYRSDLEVFTAWCEERAWRWLPTSPEAVAAFIDSEARGKSISTIKRRVCAIKFAHLMSDFPSPVEHSEVQLALRRAGRAKRRRPKQALGLTADLLQQMIAACPETLNGLRDAALISVGYDTLCRSSELAAMQVEHLSDDLATLTVPRSKADPYGDGRIAYLAPATISRLEAWLAAADLSSGPLFRGLHVGRTSDGALHTASIRRLVKTAAKRAGLAPAVMEGLSGHSMRVGAAQDMMVAGIDALGIMQAGGWRTFSVLARYVENAAAQRIHLRRWESVRAVSRGMIAAGHN